MGKNLLHRKDQLIITTIDIIDELGIQKLSTREIALRLGISEATMFRHFRSKNELLGAVLDYYSQFDQDIMQSTKLKQLNPCDAIIFLVSSYAEYYQNYPAITSIMQLMDVLRYEPDLKDKVNSILETRTCYLNQLIEAAQISGDFNPEINNEGISDMISGVVYEICLNWRVNNHSFSLKQRILSTLNMYLSVIRIKNQNLEKE